MALKTQLTKLEQTAQKMMPDQDSCPCCHGAPLAAFPDESDNHGGPRLPYDGPNGVCRLCRQPPPCVKIFPLSPDQRKAFAAIPWSANPRLRFVEKLSLILAVWRQKADGPALDRLNHFAHQRQLKSVDEQLARLYANDTNGSRHWMPPTYAPPIKTQEAVQ